MQPEFLDAVAATILHAVKSETAHLVARVDELERRAPKDGRDGQDGKDGRDGVDAPALDLQVLAEKAAALIPIPKDGRDGQDADAEAISQRVVTSLASQIADLVAQEVTKAMAALPPPVDGKNGQDGKDGAPGASVTVADVAPLILQEVTKAFEAIPVPKDGTDGKPGADGVGVAGALIDAEGRLVVTLSNGTVQTLGRVVGAKGDPGKDGKDGADGVGFDDVSVDHDGDRTLSVVFAKGERVKSYPVVLPVPIHRGVFEASKEYQRGDQTTWAGSTWQAIRPTSGLKPGDGPPEKTGWVLVTKKGTDGRHGKDGIDGKPGRDGKDGVQPWSPQR